MEISRKWRFSCLLLGLFFLATTLQGVQGEVELGPSESECRVYIEKALKELETAETEPTDQGGSEPGAEDAPVEETTTYDSEHDTSAGEHDIEQGDQIESIEAQQEETASEASAEETPEPVEETSETKIEEGEAAAESIEEGEKPSEEAAEELVEQLAEQATADESAEVPAEELQDTQGASESSPAETEEQVPAEGEEGTTEASVEEAAAESHEVPSEAVESAETTPESIEVPIEIQEASLETQESQGKSQEVQSQEAPLESLEAQTESQEVQAEEPVAEQEAAESLETTAESQEGTIEDTAAESQEAPAESQEGEVKIPESGTESQEGTAESQEGVAESQEGAAEESVAESQEGTVEEVITEDGPAVESHEAVTPETPAESQEGEEGAQADEAGAESAEGGAASVEKTESAEAPEETTEKTDDAAESAEKSEDAETALSAETAESVEKVASSEVGDVASVEKADTAEGEGESVEGEPTEEKPSSEGEETSLEKEKEEEPAEAVAESGAVPEGEIIDSKAEEEKPIESEGESKETVPEEDLTLDIDIPDNLRPRDHIDQLLKLDDSNSEYEAVINRVSEITLKELKRLYENAIKPLETLYKYRDLSNRHFGDSEIFSKPLVLFMGPWSGGKSSIINYLTDNEYNTTSLRTGAEPSPAYFNLLMYGDEPEVLDGTQLAADFTFAGLQKFGQGLEERLRGLKLPNKLLEKINIVEIPGILEVRKQVSRMFPFNDACQWFIDRADIIFLVYDPSKLDVGPETEAILDQLKGREHQTRIILNKADQVKPEELMRVQGALIWNISPLMSSAQPPVMYTTSLWSRPYEAWAPVRLLQAQERAFLRDLRSAVDKRIENKISSARRFAVRVRNHAKMVDCYLTTYYNHKSVFGNRKQVADQIIEHPQDYHIYEGLSTLTNISRYDLPDPDVYRDFFRLNPLYDFQQLSATCTYFRGCPINRLDVAIAYDLPEMVGKHKKLVEAAAAEIKTES